MSRDDDRRRLEAEALAALLVSCPECGTLCRRFRGYDWDGQVFDLNPSFVPWDHMPEWVHVAAITQGIGVGNGRSHRCPPTLSPLTPDTPTLAETAS